ncbi:hypothetical protein BgiBS90_004878, partial [Biomphalaria glabrata]
IIEVKVELLFDDYMFAYAAKSVSEMMEIQIRKGSYYENYLFENPLHRMECTTENYILIKYFKNDFELACKYMGARRGLLARDNFKHRFGVNIFCAMCTA